jgi:hypothetical protein
VPLGSAVTNLMVWHDLDYGVDAPGCTRHAAWEALEPLLVDCERLHYEHVARENRLYFVLRLDGWKLDISIWADGMPPFVEEYQRRLLERLDGETRLTVLVLKEAWWRSPLYPEEISGFQIYDAVLEHGVRTVDELDAYARERGLPTREG